MEVDDAQPIHHAPPYLLQATLLSPDYLSVLVAHRGAVLTLRSAATCHAFLAAALATPDELWHAACEMLPLVAATTWQQTTWKATYRQQMLARRKPPCEVLPPPHLVPEMFELGMCLHSGENGQQHAAWSPMTDFHGIHGPILARWPTGFRLSGDDCRQLLLDVQIRRKEDGKILNLAMDEGLHDSGFIWDLFSASDGYNVRFNVDFVLLPNGLTGAGHQLDLDEGPLEGEDWADTYLELIIYPYRNENVTEVCELLQLLNTHPEVVSRWV